MWIAFKDPHGIVPLFRGNPREIPSGYAQAARNCKLEDGAIKPIRGLVTVATPTKTGTKRTIFQYKDTDPPLWMHWLQDVDIVRSVTAGDTTGLLLFTGDGYPRITDSVYATSGGGTDYPNVSFRPGAPKPSAPPSITVNGAAPGEDDDAAIETVAYRYCFCAVIGGVKQYGPLSDPTTYVDVSFGFGQTITLSEILTSPGAGYQSTGMTKRIYRATIGSSTAGWQFVDEIPLAQATFTDSTLTQNLSQTIAISESYYPPPDAMTGIRAMPSGSVVGFVKNRLIPSEPYLMHAYNPDYQRIIEYPIVCIEIVGQTALVLTEGVPYLYTGSHPSSATPDKLGGHLSCMSKRGALEINGMVYWPTPEGIAAFNLTDGAGLTTVGLLDMDSWAHYAPASINAYMVQGWYIGFYNTGTVAAGFMFNPATREFVDLDLHATAGFNDLSQGKLYLQVGDTIAQWDSDAENNLTLYYKTRPEPLPYPCCMGYGRVLARGYPITFGLYDRNDRLIKTISVKDREPFVIGSGYLSDEYAVDVSGKHQVDWIGLGETIFDIEEAYNSGEH